MQMEFRHPEYQTPIVTSPVQEIREPQCQRGPLNDRAVDREGNLPCP
jgi:hypothetical protein